MGLFTQSQIDQINKVAEKSKHLVEAKKTSKNIQSMNQEIQEMSNKVVEYFKDSNSILITSPEELHDYVTKAIESGYCGIDTETTGLDRQKDTIVGASLYYPGSCECYIPSKHIVPIFDEPYKNQLSYEIIGSEFQRFVDAGTKMIFANADFDLSMIYKDLGVDMIDICYYDVILAWRCLKEDERDNSLKGLYMKYVMKGHGDPMKFSDFFSPALFPYCRPEVAKLYAANDAKITYELFKWQVPYTLKEHPKCIKNNLQHIADLIWNVEFPMIKICQEMHRTGIFLDDTIANTLKQRYKDRREVEAKKLSDMVNAIIADTNYIVPPFTKSPFVSGEDFNCNSPMHVKHLLYNIMNIPEGKKGKSTDKAVLNELNLPVTDQILKVRSLDTLINSFVKKLPQVKGVDRRVHAQFRQIGADTGRMSSAEPNLQNIPSHANDIRHMFRATPQKYHIKDCDDKDNFIHIQLPLYYDMKTPSGYRQVKDLHVGDDVILLKDREEHINKIVDIVNSEVIGNVDIFIQAVNRIMSGWKAPVRSPAYVMLSSDYSAQEPRLTAFVSGDAKMQDAFVKGRDVYASIASTAFNVPYEKCLEFHPKTGEYQPDGKARRNEAKTILLGRHNVMPTLIKLLFKDIRVKSL